MSWQACRWAAEACVGSATAKLVLFVLAEASDRKHECWLGHVTIAQRAELTRRSVVAQMQHLERVGAICRTSRGIDRQTGQRLSDLVRLCLSPSEPASPGPGERDALSPSEPASPGPGEPHDRTRCISRPNPGERRSQKQEVLEQKERTERRAQRATLISTAWQLSESERAYAANEGFSPDQIGRMAETFRQHHTAKGSTFKSWAAAWRTWVSREGPPLPVRDKAAFVDPSLAPQW